MEEARSSKEGCGETRKGDRADCYSIGRVKRCKIRLTEFSNDRWGNRWADATIPQHDLTPATLDRIDPANNRVIWAKPLNGAQRAITFDVAGNMIAHPDVLIGTALKYDAENRLVTAGPTTYVYDGEGRRVKKVGTTLTYFIYDGAGQLAAEEGDSGSTVAGTQYLTRDHLGSVRVISGASGVLERHDFLPFGDEITVSSGGPRFGITGYGVDQVARQKFTGKERDAETGLDYFGIRVPKSRGANP